MFCRNCGQQVNDGARFCPKCGTPISSSSGRFNEGSGNSGYSRV